MRDELSAEQFVRAWQTCNSVTEVSEVLKISRTYARTRASQLRHRGIPLKLMNTRWDKLDVEALTKLARELEK